MPAERGRTRAPWKLTWAGKYDRYARDLIPGRTQVAMIAAVAVLIAALLWLATAPGAVPDWERVMALFLPVVMVVVVLVIRIQGEDDG